ncbi:MULTISPECIES: transporter substrate-binding domain-containing protein [Paenibacillus]|uniref:transporter substrate-binding domain-containing protein n=1 Tax=Paenibacillus TaxID=44249 RepID=UPI00096F7A51|nr:transporter substrate-binding domain-containing protein [Paenibacillus odorifer]OMD80786.1 basic amino acid ABC transporter substrate-binding protein [Paenibacillus odorifer]OMD82387.1 basic amino acid ABC transporter substrate-binding protein [Paenibacillus odorifer]OMD96183.1 basic amino acid ABC transporter substrate-binding protein [Paenibacillus odorifer]
MKIKGRVLMSVFISFVVVALVGCGANNSKAGNESSAEKIKFASDASYAPMEYMDTDKIKGFDIDFIKAVMEEAGIDYDVTNTGWETMLQSVKQGTEYQAGLSSVSITDERKETYDYSIPYFESTNMIMVKEGSDIKNALDLKDKVVAIQGATTADDLMSGIMGVDNPNLKRFDSNAVALMELNGGGADAVVADIAIVREYMKNNPKQKLVGIVDTENFGAEYYGILYPKGSELKAKLDPAIKKVLENGKYAEIYKTWFGEEPNLDSLLNAK